jgi:hypothetical protein
VPHRGDMVDERDELLAELVHERLAHVTFGGDIWSSLTFDSGARLSLYRWPVMHRDAQALSQGDAGYADALIALVGTEVVAAGASTGRELIIAFDGGVRLSVDLGGSLEDASSHDAAVFHGVRSELIGVWTIGELPPTG